MGQTKFLIFFASKKVNLQNNLFPTILRLVPAVEFYIDVQAVDVSDTSLESPMVPVYIHWCDVNIPEFVPPLTRNFSIVENDASFFYQVQTTTNDEHFYIVDGNANDYFQITSDGNITIKNAPDRETSDFEQIIIQAKSLFGNGKESATNLTLNFDILDINDNTPSITSITHPPTFYTNVTYTNATLDMLTATDPDLGNNGSLTYKIEWHELTFPPLSALPTGQLSVNGQFNLFEDENYIQDFVFASACDQGSTPKCGYANINVSKFHFSSFVGLLSDCHSYLAHFDNDLSISRKARSVTLVEKLSKFSA